MKGEGFKPPVTSPAVRSKVVVLLLLLEFCLLLLPLFVGVLCLVDVSNAVLRTPSSFANIFYRFPL